METMALPVAEGGPWIGPDWTVELLDQLPDPPARRELLDGALIVTPPPSVRHQGVAGELYMALRAACPADHRVLMAPVDWRPDEHTVLQPDILVVPRSLSTGGQQVGTPSLAVEVLSPSTEWIDRGRKFTRYAEGGIAQYWLVDPGDADRLPVVEVYDLADRGYELQVRADSDAPVAIRGPVSVTLRPADLGAW